MNLKKRLDDIEREINHRNRKEMPEYFQAVWKTLLVLDTVIYEGETKEEAIERTEAEALKKSGLTKEEHEALLNSDTPGEAIFEPRPKFIYYK